MKRKETITHRYVDEYGEVKQTTEFVEYQSQRQYLNNGPFVTMWQSALLHLAICDLLPRELRLLLLLMGECGQDNTVIIDNYYLAQALGYKHTTHVSEAMTKLQKRGYIVVKKVGLGKVQSKQVSVNYDQLNSNTEQINVNLCYKGKIEDFKKLAAAQSTPITDGDGTIKLDNKHRVQKIDLTDASTFDKQGRLFP